MSGVRRLRGLLGTTISWGAIAGRAIFAMARRAPAHEREPAALAEAGFASDRVAVLGIGSLPER